MSDKPIKVKPHFYAVCMEGMQQLAKDAGYNLLVHGSMSRDLDLIAIPWIDNPKSHLELLQHLCDFLGVPSYGCKEHYMHSVLPGGRDSYVINLNRGGKFNGYADAQYYLDISFSREETNWKQKYDKCITVIKRFDAGIIGMYDL